MSDNKPLEDNPSKMWYLLPIFISWIGGIVMFFVLRKRNFPMARNGLIIGLLVTIIPIVFFFYSIELAEFMR